MDQPESASLPMEQPALSDQNEQDKLISRLMTRIAELEEKLYHADFSEEKTTVVQPMAPPKPEAPKLGFLSAIRAGLRQLEESTGYSSPATPIPTASQPHSPGQQINQPRIVYYQAPPQEIVEQLQLHQGGQLQVETSQASSSSATTTASAADWISSRLGFPAKSPLETPRELQAHHRQQPQQQSSGGLSTTDGQESLSTGVPHDLARLSLRPVASEGNLNASGSFSGAPAAAPGPQPRLPPTPSREGLATVGGRGPQETSSSGGGAGKGASDWFSSLFKKDWAGAPLPPQPQQPLQQFMPSPGPGVRHGVDGQTATDAAGTAGQSSALQRDSSYYRYVFDPADVAAEMEVTARVRKVAAEALMQAEDRLKAAEQAQAGMMEQLEQAKELTKEIEALREANEAALATRAALEDEMISGRAALEATRAAQESLQQELDGLRTQAGIWQSATSDEKDKLKQENQLLRSQMQTRLNELQVVKSKLGEAEAERQRLVRDLDELTGKLQWLTKINKQLETSAQQLESHRKLAAEVQEKFMKERAVRRRLHEQLQQLRGNIRVMCRVRPCQPSQVSIISYPLEGLLAINPPDRRPQDFEFDHVFGPDAQQQSIYDEVSPLVRSCADGYNVCIFAYGQTGSGKTFTMEGSEEQPGINVRALQELFSIGSEEGIELNWKVQVSMLEVYNDTLHDLLLPPGEVAPRSLDVSGLGAGELPPGAERVPGASWRPVNTLDDVKQVLREGSKNRSTACTALNAHSSRSHAVLSVRVTAHANNLALRSTIHLVDLAGSERVDKSEVTGQQLKEAQSINKSLSALGDVISALQRRTPHIPFRNSKLTQVLQDSLCGTSKVLLVCNISPESNSASETLSSLNFASRAAQVELGQARKSDKVITPADRMPAQHPAAAAVASANAGGGAPAPSPERPAIAGKAMGRGVAGAAGVRSSQTMGRVSGGSTGARDSSNGSH